MRVQYHPAGGNAKHHLEMTMRRRTKGVGTMEEDEIWVRGCRVAGVDETLGPHLCRIWRSTGRKDSRRRNVGSPAVVRPYNMKRSQQIPFKMHTWMHPPHTNLPQHPRFRLNRCCGFSRAASTLVQIPQ